MSPRNPITSLRTRLSIASLIFLTFAVALCLWMPPSPVRGEVNPRVVVNKYQNATPDVVELLVIQNNLDMRGMIIKDFSSNMANDGGGKFQFSTDPLWSSVRSGTLIVLRNNNSAAD